MSGYFSVEDRGTFGHWDICDDQKRIFVIRGNEDSGFELIDERKSVNHPMRRVPFADPFEALEYVARTLMVSP